MSWLFAKEDPSSPPAPEMSNYELLRFPLGKLIALEMASSFNNIQTIRWDEQVIFTATYS